MELDDLYACIDEIERETNFMDDMHTSMKRLTELGTCIDNMRLVRNSLEKCCINIENMTIFNSENELDDALGFERLNIDALETMTETNIELLTRKYEKACEGWIADKIKQFIEWIKGIFKKIKDFFKGRSSAVNNKSDELARQTRLIKAKTMLLGLPAAALDELIRGKYSYNGKTKSWYKEAEEGIKQGNMFVSGLKMASDAILKGDARGINILSDTFNKTILFQKLTGVRLSVDQIDRSNISIVKENDLEFLRDDTCDSLEESKFSNPVESFAAVDALLKHASGIEDALKKLSSTIEDETISVLESINTPDVSDDDFSKVATNARTCVTMANLAATLAKRIDTLKFHTNYKSAVHSLDKLIQEAAGLAEGAKNAAAGMRGLRKVPSSR